MKHAMLALPVSILLISMPAHAESFLKKLSGAIGKNNKAANSQASTATNSDEIKHSDGSAPELVKPESAGSLSYEVSFETGEQVFPALILSFKEAALKQLEKKRRQTELGSWNGAFSVFAKATKPNESVRVSVLPNDFISTQTDFTYVLAEPNTVYDLTPAVAWNFEKLKQNRQPTTATFKIEIRAGDETPVTKVIQPTIRSVNESIISVVNRKGKVQNMFYMFAAFVNENDPLIDQILKEAKDLAIKNKIRAFNNFAFSGYQGGEDGVTQQVGLLWYLFQTKNFVYSSITRQTASADRVYAQYVRSLEDSYAATQANCVDGTVLFASILRKIGIDPVLVMHPGHMYLMFFADAARKKPKFVETTLLGSYRPKKVGFFHNGDQDYAGSFNSLVSASEYAAKVFAAEDRPHFLKKDPGYYMIGIDEARQLGIVPVGR